MSKLFIVGKEEDVAMEDVSTLVVVALVLQLITINKSLKAKLEISQTIPKKKG